MTDTILYHATDRANVPTILEDGIRPGSFWGTAELADYYAETVADEGGDPVILAVRLTDLPEEDLEPDGPGIAEPISTVVGMSEDEVIAAWSEVDGDWEDSLRIIGSLRCMATIPPGVLAIDTDPADTPAP